MKISLLCAPRSGPGHSVAPGVWPSFGVRAGIFRDSPATSTVSNSPRALYCGSSTMSATL